MHATELSTLYNITLSLLVQAEMLALCRLLLLPRRRELRTLENKVEFYKARAGGSR